jgi:hypothetical protein
MEALWRPQLHWLMHLIMHLITGRPLRLGVADEASGLWTLTAVFRHVPQHPESTNASAGRRRLESATPGSTFKEYPSYSTLERTPWS